MQYEEWKVNTQDNKTIHGVTDYAKDNKNLSNKVLVVVHGLTGHRDEYHIKGTANFFRDKGYDVIRFNLYAGENGRRLKDTNLQTYAADLNLILDTKINHYDKVFISGHSYGGPTIMIAQPKIATALSLWDPTFNLPKMFKTNNFVSIENSKYYIWDKNVEVILGHDFVHEYKTRYDIDECLDLSESLSDVPIQVIAAEEVYGQDKLSWHSKGHNLNERHIVKNADHCFWRGNLFQEVLRESYKWFEKF